MRRLFLVATALTLWGVTSTALADYIIIRVILKSTDSGPGRDVPPGGPGDGTPGGPGMPGPGARPGGPGGGNPAQPPVSGNLHDLGLRPDEYLTAVVEVKKRVAPERVNKVGTLPPHIETKYGKTYLFQDGVEILVDFAAIPQVRGLPLPMATPVQVFDKRFAATQKIADNYWALADYALGRGLPDKCSMCLDECILKIAEGGTAPVSNRAQKAVDAYRKIKATLNSTATGETEARKWSASLNFGTVTTSAHYAIVSQSDNPEKDGINRRLEHFEKLYKEFYLWFALRGRPLPELKEKLVCVLLNNSEKFRDQKQAFEVDELVNDGFMLQQQNVAVMSMQRLDTPTRIFKSSVTRPVYSEMGKYNGIGRDELLKGKFPEGVKTVGVGVTVRDSTRAQMVALVDMALQEEAELAAVTHEGSRQLVAATNILSATAPAPQWLRFGLASVFETPKGPFHHGSHVKVAFWSGVGAPNWAYMKAFSEMIASKEIYPNPAQPSAALLLYLAISDEFFSIANEIAKEEEKFRQANGGTNNTVNGGGDANEAVVRRVLAHLQPGEAALTKARTIAWGLTYYLMKARYAEFEKFLNELSILPRDVELDHRALVSAFAKSFALSESGLQEEYPKPGAFEGMGKNWLDFMKREYSLTEELKLEPPVINPNDPNGTGGPGIPGGPGFPGGPGGGSGPGGSPGRPGGPGGGPGRPGPGQ